jgi:hypothetical protein
MPDARFMEIPGIFVVCLGLSYWLSIINGVFVMPDGCPIMYLDGHFELSLSSPDFGLSFWHGPIRGEYV